MLIDRDLIIRSPRRTRALLGAGLLLLACACRQQMADQPRYEPLAESDFFTDGRTARPQVEGTVAQGQLRADEQLYTGRTNNQPAQTLPFPATTEVFSRGRERYDIFCSPCHDRVGNGEGMIVRRGFRPPPSLHIERLRQAPLGHFFEVISRGFGAMPGYAEQVPTEDRWAMVAYIRALQLSQNATLADVPDAERRRLTEPQR